MSASSESKVYPVKGGARVRQETGIDSDTTVILDLLYSAQYLITLRVSPNCSWCVSSLHSTHFGCFPGPASPVPLPRVMSYEPRTNPPTRPLQPKERNGSSTCSGDITGWGTNSVGAFLGPGNTVARFQCSCCPSGAKETSPTQGDWIRRNLRTFQEL